MSFLSAQTIAKPPDTTSFNRSDNYRQRANDINTSNHDDVSLEKLSNDGATKKVIIIGDSMLNKVNSHGPSNLKRLR